MKTTIITAIYDSYDTLKPTLEQSIDVEWVCVTDGPDMKPLADKGWKIVYEPRNHLHPNRAAKLPKMLPWLYATTGTSIWIDASYQVTSPRFAEEVTQYAQPIAQFKHPWRDCAYEEIEESLSLKKYDEVSLELNRQLTRLQEENIPAGWGLWATGVIARKHTPEIVSMGFDWLKENYLYSYQDQVSHPLACYLNAVRPIDLPGNHLSNDWLSYQGSGRHL